MNKEELRALAPVSKAFSEGHDQLVRYKNALQNQFGENLKLQSYIVVAVGFERLLGERQHETGVKSEKE